MNNSLESEALSCAEPKYYSFKERELIDCIIAVNRREIIINLFVEGIIKSEFMNGVELSFKDVEAQWLFCRMIVYFGKAKIKYLLKNKQAPKYYRKASQESNFRISISQMTHTYIEYGSMVMSVEINYETLQRLFYYTFDKLVKDEKVFNKFLSKFNGDGINIEVMSDVGIWE